MLLSEPPRTPYDLNFHLLGIPVRVHPFFWLAALLLGLNGNPKPERMLLWIGAVFISIVVHELGHALTARAHGWEPFITLHGFGGLASYRPTHHSTRAQLLITLAGPGAGFLFAAAIALAIVASGHALRFGIISGWPLPVLWEPFEAAQLDRFVFDLMYINIFWGLVNLLPVFPLDGGQIARELLEVVNPADGVRQSLWLSVIIAAGVAILAFTKLHDNYIGLFFGYLAYVSYSTLQSYFGPGGGLGRFR